MKPSGFFIRCKSAFDGAPIAIVLTGFDKPSANRKTGRMVQAYIIRVDIHPGEAIRRALDRAVCGPCPLRSGGGCYVEAKTIWSVWDALRRSLAGDGPYQEVSSVGSPEWERLERESAGRSLRFSAYGDPAAIHAGIVGPMLSLFTSWTGYTHTWSFDRAQYLRQYVMASVHSPRQRLAAIGKGWRTFRITPWADSPIHASELRCPSAGGVHCIDCLRCNGGLRDGSRDIVIPAHGIGASKVRRTCKERV